MGSGVLMGMAVSSRRSFHPAELCGLHPGFFLLLPTSLITKWCLCCALCSLVGSSGSSSVAARSQLTRAPPDVSCRERFSGLETFSSSGTVLNLGFRVVFSANVQHLIFVLMFIFFFFFF